jgi:hypothetical protein
MPIYTVKGTVSLDFLLLNGPNGILRRFGETDSEKKPEVENFVALSL